MVTSKLGSLGGIRGASPVGTPTMIGAGNVDVNFSTLEGFIAAKVLIEGLRRRGRDPMREGFVAALESMANCHMESADRVYHPHPL